MNISLIIHLASTAARTRRVTALAIAVVLAGSISSVTAFEIGDRVVITAKGTEIRIGTKVVDTAPLGDVLTVRKTQGSWVKVSRGKPGWVRTKDVMTLAGADDFFNRAARSNPTDVSYIMARASVLVELDQLDDALAAYGQAIRIAPQNSKAYCDRGIVWDTKGEYHKAIQDYTQSLRLDSNDAIVLNNRGVSWRKLGELEIALADFSDSIRQDPMDATPYVNRGLVWYRKKQYDEAIADYNRCIELDPGFSLAFRRRGLVRHVLKEYSRATTDYSRAIEIYPDYADAFWNRGWSMVAMKNYSKAGEDFTATIRLLPKSGSGYYGRAHANDKLGHYQDALADYRNAVSRSPNDADCLNGLAWLLASCPDSRIRDGKQAVKYARRACEKSEWKDANAIDTLAAAYAEAGDFVNAVRWQRKAVELVGSENKEDFRSRLVLFESKRPYREPGPMALAGR